MAGYPLSRGLLIALFVSLTLVSCQQTRQSDHVPSFVFGTDRIRQEDLLEKTWDSLFCALDCASVSRTRGHTKMKNTIGVLFLGLILSGVAQSQGIFDWAKGSFPFRLIEARSSFQCTITKIG